MWALRGMLGHILRKQQRSGRG
uniref:Uncharacterized protein n=1 Tax=Arundo donax TaxID=35708 RepID=A0A0A9GHR3_ARUDO